MGVWGRGIFVLCLFGSLTFSSAVFARGQHRPIFQQGDPNHPPKNYLVSKIDFPESGIPVLNYATAADTDPIKECPMESLPRDLASAVAQLVDKVKANVTDIKAIQGSRCAALADRLQESKTLVGNAITYQFMTGVATSDQAQINSSTRKAGALSSLISTAANVVDQNCVASLTDAVTIQKLIGQIITLSGLFAGGWEGVGLSSIGMLISNLPLFRSDVDSALEMVAKYQEINKRGSFLCLYRQMQRTSCLLFAPQEGHIINGFDLTLKTGPARKTEDTLAEIQKSERGSFLLEDVNVLRTLVRSSEAFLASAKTNLFKEATVESFEKLKEWCRSSNLGVSSLRLPELHPKPILAGIFSLNEKCQKIEQWEWESFLQSGNTLNSIIWSSFGELYTLTDYYNSGSVDGAAAERPRAPQVGLFPVVGSPVASADPHKTEGQSLGLISSKEDWDVRSVLSTLEAKVFFTELKGKIESFHNPYQGNQERLNYLSVTETVGQKFAKGTFKDFMKRDNADLSRKRWFSSLLRRDIPIRKKALSAMVSACQMFDPTLACLYANRPEGDPFFKTWKKECVGSSSRLCKFAIKRSEIERLLPDPKERAYFESLCGIKTWLKGG